MTEPEQPEQRVYVPWGVVPPPGRRFERPMDRWLDRERRYIRGLAPDERLVVVPGSVVSRADARGGGE